MAAARRKHAGRGQVSSVVLTDEVLARRSHRPRHTAASRRSRMQSSSCSPTSCQRVWARRRRRVLCECKRPAAADPCHASTAARSQITPPLRCLNAAAALAARRGRRRAGQGTGARRGRAAVDRRRARLRPPARLARAEASLAAAAPPPEGKRRIEAGRRRWGTRSAGRARATARGFGGAAPSAHAMGMGGGHPAYEYVPPLEKPFAIRPTRRRWPCTRRRRRPPSTPRPRRPPPPPPPPAADAAAGGAEPDARDAPRGGCQYGTRSTGWPVRRRARRCRPPARRRRRVCRARWPRRASSATPVGPSAGQLLYDQEQRRWVSRDGVPARYDPLLKGMAAAVPSAPQPVGSAVARRPCDTAAAAAVAAGCATRAMDDDRPKGVRRRADEPDAAPLEQRAAAAAAHARGSASRAPSRHRCPAAASTEVGGSTGLQRHTTHARRGSVSRSCFAMAHGSRHVGGRPHTPRT